MVELYRFRSITSLFENYQELENQSVYFASPEELNDPMERFRIYFWQGDEIVWRSTGEARAVDHSCGNTIRIKTNRL